MAIFYNQATLSYSGGTINSNITTGELAETVTAAKTAVTGTYAPGGRIAYALTIVNSGESDATDVEVTDDLGGYLFDGETVYPLAYQDGSLVLFVDGVEQPAPDVVAGPPLRIGGFDLPAGSDAVLLYEAAVTAYAPLGPDAEITNTASVSGGCVPVPLSAAATVAMDTAPMLSVAKSMCPGVVTGCSGVEYTFVIQNVGGEAGPEADVVIRDVFNPVLKDLTVTVDTEPSPRIAYNYDEETGEFETAAGQLIVPGATFAQNGDGSWTTTPGVLTLTVSGSF